MQIIVKLFGVVRESVGENELTIELQEEACIADLRDQMAARYDLFQSYGNRLRVSVNREFVGEDHPLQEGDEAAFLPPVSGGVGRCTISDQPLDVGAVIGRVSGPEMGGIVTFIGAVRDHARGHQIERLEYESYPEMAESEMSKIVSEAEDRWSGTKIAVAHRVGVLGIGELAVVIAAAAPHRGDAFEACRYTIDTLKERVPIWKKEFSTDGEYWVDDHA